MECKPRSALLRSQAEHGWHSSPDDQCELTIPAQPNLSTDVFPCVKSLIYRWENKKAAVSSKAKKTKKKEKKKEKKPNDNTRSTSTILLYSTPSSPAP